jgi:hypothetical protein
MMQSSLAQDATSTQSLGLFVGPIVFTIEPHGLSMQSHPIFSIATNPSLHVFNLSQ